MIKTGDFRAAASALAPLIAASSDARDLYRYSLTALRAVLKADGGTDAALDAELEALVRLELAAHGAGAPQLQQLVYDLIEVGAQRAAIPALQALAQIEPERWYYALRAAAIADARPEVLAENLELRLKAGGLEAAVQQTLIDELRTFGGPQQAVDFALQLATRTDLAAAEQDTAHNLFLSIAQAAGRVGLARDYLQELLLRDGTLESAKPAYIAALLRIAGPAAALPHLARRVRLDGLSIQAQHEAYFPFKDAAIASAETAQLIAFLREKLDGANADTGSHELYMADLLEQAGAGAVVPYLRRYAERTDLDAQAWSGAYYSFREGSAAAKESAAFGRWVQTALARRGRADPLWQTMVADVRVFVGDAAVLPNLRTLLEQRGGTLAEDEPAYYAYQEAALSAGLADDFLSYLDQRLADLNLAAQRRDLYVYDLGRVGGIDRLAPYLLARIARSDITEKQRLASYYQLRDGWLAVEQSQDLIDFIRTSLGAPGPAQAALPWSIESTFLADLSQHAGAMTALPWLEVRAKRSELGLEKQSEAYFAFKEASLKAKHTDALVALIEANLAQDTGASPARVKPAGLNWLAELRAVGGDVAVLPHLRAALERLTIGAGVASEQAQASYYAYQDAAIAAHRVEDVVRFLERKLADQNLDDASRELFVYDLGRLGGPKPLMAYLELQVLREDFRPDRRLAAYWKLRETVVSAGAQENLLAFIGQGLQRGGLPDSLESTYLADLTTLGGTGTALPLLQARAVRQDLGLEQRAAAYHAFREAAMATGRQDLIVDFVESRLGDGKTELDERAPLIAELRAVAGDEAVLPHLLASLERLTIGAGATSEQAQASYYAYQDAAIAANRVEDVVRFLEQKLAAQDLDDASRELFVYDLGRLGGPKPLMAYLERQILREDFEPDRRLAAYWKLKEAVVAAGAQESLLAFIHQGLQRGGLPDSMESTYLADLATFGGTDTALPLLQARALRQDLGLEQRAAAYHAFREAALAVGRQDLIVAFVENRLGDSQTGLDERTPLIAELRALAGDEAALPFMRAQAEREDLGAKEAEAVYYVYQETAVSASLTDEFVAFLETRLEQVDRKHVLHAAYLFDLGRLGGSARLLPFLEALVNRTDIDPKERAGLYYGFRDAALESGRNDMLVTRLAQWLDARGPDSPLAEIWLYDLRTIGGVGLALPYLREALDSPHASAEDALAAYYAFESAAQEAGRSDVLVEFLEQRLQVGVADPKLEAVYVNGLITRATRGKAATIVARLANADPVKWATTYLDLLLKNADEDEFVAYAARHGANRQLPHQLRRSLADTLLARGKKAAALGAYTTMAQAEPPGGQTVATLLYLWGPRPETDALEWLSARASNATGRERAAWASMLTQLGAPRRAANLLRARAEDADADPLVIEIYVNALTMARDKVALATFLTALLKSQPTPAIRRWAAKASANASLEAVSAAAWRSVLAAQPNDSQALRHLGLAAFGAGRRSEALEYLGRYLAQVDEDYEVHFFYGEVLSERRFLNRAIPHYQKVLELIEFEGAASFRMRTVQAQSLHRLGHVDAALAAFSKLIAERPDAGHLRADYVTMLLDNRQLRKARAAIAPHRVSL